jgi:hypothetical protein
VAKVEEIVAKMRRNPKGIRYWDLCNVCDFYFAMPGRRAAVTASIKRLGRVTLE